MELPDDDVELLKHIGVYIKETLFVIHTFVILILHLLVI